MWTNFMARAIGTGILVSGLFGMLISNLSAESIIVVLTGVIVMLLGINTKDTNG